MLTPEQKFIQYLKFNNQRLTDSREKVLKMIFHTHDHIHLDDILHWAGENNISRATVFRTLNLLVESGMVSKVFDDKHHVHYEHVYAHSDHCHLICTKCGKITNINLTFSDDDMDKICDNNEFVRFYNIFNIFGICNRCQ